MRKKAELREQPSLLNPALRPSTLKDHIMNYTNQNINQIVPIQDSSDTTKQSRFVDLAGARTTKILKYMDILQKCFDKNTYAYTEDQVSAILTALEAKIAHLRSASERGTSSTQFTF